MAVNVNCCLARIAGLLAFYLTLHVAANDSQCSSLYIPTVQLQNGVAMPVLVLGVCQLITRAGVQPDLHTTFRGMVPERAYRQVELALSKGMWGFDTALIYRTGRPLGQVLGEWWRKGRIERKDIWLTTKIFHPDSSEMTFRISHMPEMHVLTPHEVSVRTRNQFEESLHEIGVGYVDLMLLHWPSKKGQGNSQENRARRFAAWQVLEDMYERGWARAIGVSNFSPAHMEQLKEDGARITPMVNQFEASISIQYPELLKYCLSNGIVPQAYSPLGRGLSKQPDLVYSIAKKYGKDAGQIAFRYLFQLGYAITYLTNSESRMVSNAQIFDFELSDDDMKSLHSLNRHDGGWGLPSPFELD